MRATKASANFESKRMFESNFFEFFSRIPPWQPPAIYVPLIGYWLYRSVAVGVAVLPTIGLYLLGILTWTLLEYWAHRKLFHFHPTSKLGKRLIWILHGVHHDWPDDKYRLVFPPTLSLLVAAAIFGGLTLSVGEMHRYAPLAGIATGYLAYDMIHYATHHFSMKSRAGKFLRQYHMVHHFKYPQLGFGVSNPLWDYVFGTTYPSGPQAKPSASTSSSSMPK